MWLRKRDRILLLIMKNHQFVAKINALQPLLFLTTALITVGACTYKPELAENNAIVGVIAGSLSAASSLANTVRDND